MIDADMSVDIQEPERSPTVCHALLRKGTSELCSTTVGGQTAELAPQGLHFGRPVETENPSEILRHVLLECLGPLDPQKRHEQQGYERGA